MMALDYDDFRADIGDANEAFGDEEIDKLETRATNRWGADVAYEGARVLALQQLLASSAKFNDYTSNESSEKKSQIFKNLQELLKVYKADLDDKQDEIAAAAGAKARFGGTVKKPSRLKEYPDA
jgi:hypothetical protein